MCLLISFPWDWKYGALYIKIYSLCSKYGWFTSCRISTFSRPEYENARTQKGRESTILSYLRIFVFFSASFFVPKRKRKDAWRKLVTVLSHSRSTKVNIKKKNNKKQNNKQQQQNNPPQKKKKNQQQKPKKMPFQPRPG